MNSPERGQKNYLFDLIVLDLNMPISNGYEACQNILQKYDITRILKIAIGPKKMPLKKGMNKLLKHQRYSSYLDSHS